LMIHVNALGHIVVPRHRQQIICTAVAIYLSPHVLCGAAVLVLGALVVRWGLIIVPVQPAAGSALAAPKEITGQSLCRSNPPHACARANPPQKRLLVEDMVYWLNS